MSNDERENPEANQFDLAYQRQAGDGDILGPDDEPLPADVAPDSGESDDVEARLPAEASDEATEIDRHETEEEKEEEEGKETLLAKLRNASPYTVMLAVSLAAILIGILCLVLELNSYGRDIKAEDAKQRLGAAPAVQSGPPSTTAAA